ncbi:hypothetical protein RhiirC2_792143 [Rhizophagus irregularis]|uniref:Uncharacterized protein n=1 Tax=Rhizophagus irregularis TaxID=588596 RepID=A0A2N1MHX7_9GLOM|nr:hypothetical protein RhiirC2_792143 [Rhizophagus irregularis]
MDNVNFVSTSSMEITFSAPRPNKDKEENKEENKGKSQEISKAGRITLSASRPNLSMDNYNGTQSQQAVNVSWKTNQESINLTPSSSGPVWECDSETRRLGVQKLLGNECLDLIMPVETRSPNHVSNKKIQSREINNGTIRKLQSYSELVDRLKNDYKFREFHEPTDKGEMERGMHILGINNLEGLADYLYHPDKICAVMEDTGELVPAVEPTRRVMKSWKMKS